MLDLILYSIFRVCVFLMRFLPLAFWLFLARMVARPYYYLDFRRGRRAAVHLKLAFPQKTVAERKTILRSMYCHFAQNVMEALYAPYVDERFVRRYVQIKGWDVYQEACRAGKGIVFLGCHAGSWELSNIACAILMKESRYGMLVRPQKKTKRIDAFLNSLRQSKGCDVIRVTELKRMVAHLMGGHVLGAVADHGGREGVAVPFFGKEAMTPTGTLKLAKKSGAAVLLAFMRRLDDTHHEMIFESFSPSAPGWGEDDLKRDLIAMNAVFEKWIRCWPQEYLWFYRRWKYSPQRRVLILSDGKAGHVKQSLALIDLIRELPLDVHKDVVVVKFRNRLAARWLALGTVFLGRLWARLFLRHALEASTFKELTGPAYDIVIAAGSSLAAVNVAVSYENDAKSIAILRPGILPARLFDLVVLPEHDRPPKKKNILTVVGSLTTIAPQTLREDFEQLERARPALKDLENEPTPKIGLLIGGDSKNYVLNSAMLMFLCQQIKKVLEETKGRLLVTTSRRTSPEVAQVLRQCFDQDPRCSLLVIASQDNPAGTVGGIFYLANVLVVTGESISMVSEAVASARHVVVFEPHRLVDGNKVQRFLERLTSGGAIYLVKLNEIYDKLSWIIRTRPAHPVVSLHSGIKDALTKVL